MKRLALLLLVALGVSCAPMLDGGPVPARTPPHFVLVVHNTDVGAADTASVTWWHASSITGTVEKLVPAGGEARIDLDATPPDGFQICMTAWAGIPGGAGGNCFGSPDYAGTWTFHVVYPSGGTWKGP